MKEHNIFSEEVTIPEIVKKKADNAFYAIKTERTDKMQGKTKTKRTGRIIGILAAAAACAAVATAGILAAKDTGRYGEQAEDALFTAFEQIDRMFTLQVKAKESEEPVLLSDGKAVPVTMRDDKSESWVLGADEQSGILDYCIGMPDLLCEGEQIESVTYSINHGAFQIVQPEQEESIVIDGQLYEGGLNTGSIGGDYDEERGGEPSRPFEVVLYQSFTLDYARQSDEFTWINFCNVRQESGDIIPLFWGEEISAETYQSGMQKMLDDTVITCTVHYADHTSQSADIKVGAQIMTRREAGDVQEEGMDPEYLEEETVAVTFEMQPQE